MADGGSRSSESSETLGKVVRVRRRTLLRAVGGGLVAVAGAGALYRSLALFSSPPQRVYGPPSGGYPLGQYQIAHYGVRIVSDATSGVAVEVPPLWNLVITANLKKAPTLDTQRQLESALQVVEKTYPYAPSGVFILIGYGLPYFRTYIPTQVFDTHLPRMADSGAPVLIDAIQFAGDSPSLLLEQNEVVVHMRSDSLDVLQTVQRALFEHGALPGQSAAAANVGNLFTITSVRTGFVGAGLPRRMASQAKLPFADQIPEAAPLFMGFTSTQQQGQATEATVSFDGKRNPLLAPLTTARPGDYFAGGTSLHLSHLTEDLNGWYALSYAERLARMFHYDAAAVEGRVTVDTHWLNPNPTALDATSSHILGHNEAVQRGSRSPEGQALQLRADFNTMDALDAKAPSPGVHFLAFTAGSPIFHQGRQAMVAADMVSEYGIAPASNGINAFIQATRRQNFLAPPRQRRSFPLIEFAPG